MTAYEYPNPAAGPPLVPGKVDMMLFPAGLLPCLSPFLSGLLCCMHVERLATTHCPCCMHGVSGNSVHHAARRHVVPGPAAGQAGQGHSGTGARAHRGGPRLQTTAAEQEDCEDGPACAAHDPLCVRTTFSTLPFVTYAFSVVVKTHQQSRKLLKPAW